MPRFDEQLGLGQLSFFYSAFPHLLVGMGLRHQPGQSTPADGDSCRAGVRRHRGANSATSVTSQTGVVRVFVGCCDDRGVQFFYGGPLGRRDSFH